MKVCINFTITQNNDFKYQNLENLTPDSQNIMHHYNLLYKNFTMEEPKELLDLTKVSLNNVEESLQ